MTFNLGDWLSFDYTIGSCWDAPAEGADEAMPAEPEKNEWFRPKRYGFGWTPAGWKGWLVTVGGASSSLPSHT